MEIKLVLNGLDCANCANKIEDKVNKIKMIFKGYRDYKKGIRGKLK